MINHSNDNDEQYEVGHLIAIGWIPFQCYGRLGGMGIAKQAEGPANYKLLL